MLQGPQLLRQAVVVLAPDGAALAAEAVHVLRWDGA